MMLYLMVACVANPFPLDAASPAGALAGTSFLTELGMSNALKVYSALCPSPTSSTSLRPPEKAGRSASLKEYAPF
jgi:hypothetical protein